MQDHGFPDPGSPHVDFKTLRSSARTSGIQRDGSKITALNIEFVAKPGEAHKVHAALPPAINGALGGVAGFAGSLVMIANYEARLVTVVTLWTGEDQLQRCNENVRWVRALLAPYLDRCLRVQTLSAYVPVETRDSQQFDEPSLEEELEIRQPAGVSVVCAA
jgi:hypothetical protein